MTQTRKFFLSSTNAPCHLELEKSPVRWQAGRGDRAKNMLVRKIKTTRARVSRQLEFKAVRGWGGRRKGAGRPNLSGEVNHMKRERISARTPIHITLKLKEGIPNLRRHALLKEFKKSIVLARRQGLFILHFSILSNHIHLLAESKNNQDTALGLRPLAGRFAKILRRHANRWGEKLRGSVFKGRYHLKLLKTPTEVKRTLEYVLLNFAKHRGLMEHMDEFSSAPVFKQWRKLLGSRFRDMIKSDSRFWEIQHDEATDLNKILSRPKSWLAAKGWLRAA